MTAAELVKLIRALQGPSREADRLYFYQALQPYLVQSDYDWQDHMNDPAEQGIIQSGVYLVWAQDTESGIHLWDTTGKRYLISFSFDIARGG